MTIPWTLVVAAPLERVVASVEPLAVKPALSSLGDDATVARFEAEASTPGALALELRERLGAVVDEVGLEGLRAVDSLDGVADLEGARKAPGAYVSAPPAASFADAAALFGSARRADAPAIKTADDLAAKLGAALDAREDAAAMETKLRASRGIAEWDALLGVKPPTEEAPLGDRRPRAAADMALDATRARDAMRDAIRAEHPEAIEAQDLSPDLQKSARRKGIEELVRGSGEDGATTDDGSAAPEGKIGEP
ncbi:hypothetical protein WMF04_34525 [Sorangium sp. So ce260]|uniref:hypothetical protein n=1 Tax=Sorangium sp. So ce260 TaxID=3133291 RepID=UPI003F6091F1